MGIILILVGLLLISVGTIMFLLFFYLYFKQKMEYRELQKNEYFKFLENFNKNLQN